MRTYYHFTELKNALGKHMTPAGIDRVFRYNFGVDFYGVIAWKILQYKIFPLYPAAHYWYKPLDHFDQMNKDEALGVWHDHIQWIMDVADDAKYPLADPEKIFRTLGRSSHAISDIFSHSNLIELIYDYFRNDAAAADIQKESGLELDDFLVSRCPLFSQLLESEQFDSFRKDYLPKLYTFQSLPDEGPDSHEERNLDDPTAPGASKEEYPRAFDIALYLGQKELEKIFDELFSNLKENNPEKYRLLTETGRDANLGAAEQGPATRRSKWWSDRFGVWG